MTGNEWDVIGRVRALHHPQERYHDGGGEWSTATKEEAAAIGDCDLSAVESFTVCGHCGDIEMAEEQHEGWDTPAFLQALWPCPTIRTMDADQ